MLSLTADGFRDRIGDDGTTMGLIFLAGGPFALACAMA